MEPKRESISSLTGILVNGQLIGAKKAENGKLKTYFGKLGFYFQKEDMKIEISTETITLNNGSFTSRLSWSDTARLGNQRQVVFHLDSHLPLKPGCRNKPMLNVSKEHTVIIVNTWKLRFREVVLIHFAIPGTRNCFQAHCVLLTSHSATAYSKCSTHVCCISKRIRPWKSVGAYIGKYAPSSMTTFYARVSSLLTDCYRYPISHSTDMVTLPMESLY